MMRVQGRRAVRTGRGSRRRAAGAGVRRVEVITAPERDEAFNPLGIKGIGKIGIVGVNAAVANAVFHATGCRVRALPIRAESLLGRMGVA